MLVVGVELSCVKIDDMCVHKLSRKIDYIFKFSITSFMCLDFAEVNALQSEILT